MRMNDVVSAFPQMPEEMRRMVEFEVARQMKIERPIGRRELEGNVRSFSGKKLAMFGLAASMLFGLTAAACVKFYQMYSEKQGNYGTKTGVTVTGTVAETIPEVELQVGYVPEMLYECLDACYPGKYHCKNEEAPHTSGVSLYEWALTTESNLALMEDSDVVERKEMEIGGHEAVCLKKQVISTEGVKHNWVLYILYPEVQHMVQMYVSEGVPEEEMIKMAESIELVSAGETLELDQVYTWDARVDQQDDIMIIERKLTASLEEMKKLHMVGEQIEVPSFTENGFVNGIKVKVKEVQVADDLALLTAVEAVEDKWKRVIDETGKLKTDRVQYIKNGDGIHTLDEVVKTEEKAQKLLYLTLEYTNTNNQELKNVLFFQSIMALEQRENEYVFRWWEKQQEDGNWDRVLSDTLMDMGEMEYYNVRGKTRYNNYISSMQPGETVTIDVAWIVHEEDLPYLYLNLMGSGHEFVEKGLRTGYVDIRQEEYK